MSQTTIAAASRAEMGETLFRSLVVSDPARGGQRHGATLAASVVLHSALALTVVLVPLLLSETVPADEGLRAFFVTPLELAPPAPPPPPPPAGARVAQTVAPRAVVQQPAGFVAPIEVPQQITPEDGLELGVEGGVVGGVEGGVPGGVVGGVVGGLPLQPPAPAPEPMVRIGGQLAAPKLVRRVAPVYPDLARLSRVTATVVLEAEVDKQGYVRAVRIVSGQPLFDDAAVEALRQWRYQPLLLNGEPTAFVLTVRMGFQLREDPAM